MKQKKIMTGVCMASALLSSAAVMADNNTVKTNDAITSNTSTIDVQGDTASINKMMKERTLGEVVITTQKRNQSSIEVPVAVSAMTGTMMSNLHLNQMDQVSAFIPGIQIQQQSPNNSGYAVRGVTSDDGSATSQPRVSVFLDGISNFRTQSSQVELFDMDRVEVAKGPQGTLFGRGAEIGAIDMIRKRPVNYSTGEISINYGTRNQFGVSGFLNTPFSSKVFNRFAFQYDRHDGYIKNDAGGRLNGKESLALRNSTRFLFNDKAKGDLILDYQYDNYPGTSFKSNHFDGDDFDANTSANLEEGEWLGIKRHIGGALFNFDYDCGNGLRLTSISGFRGYKSDENFDADGTYLPLLKCTENAKGIQASEELRLNFDNHGPLKGFAGVSYFYEHAQQGATLESNMQYLYPNYIQTMLKSQFSGLSTALSSMDFGTYSALKPAMVQMVNQLMNKWFVETGGTQAVTSLPDFYGDLDNSIKAMTSQAMGISLGLDQILAMMGVDNSSTLYKQLATIKALSNIPLTDSHKEDMTNYAENQSIDIFVDGSWSIVKHLTATLGLRGTYEHQRSGYSSTSVTTDNPFGALLYQPTANGATVWAQKDYTSWVGRFALNYMFGRNNVYASLSRGRRPGVIAFNNNGEDINQLRPETIWSYEGGVKGYLSQKLYYDLCLYYYDWYHFQSTALVDNAASLAKMEVATDGGRAHSLGFEATLRYNICRGLNIFGSYAYTDAKFNDTDEDGNTQEYAGNTFRLTPKHSFSLGANVTIPTSESAFIYFTPTYTWKSKVYFEDSNEETLSQKAFGLLNFSLGYHFAPSKINYDISIFGRNALDQKYIVDAGNSGRQIGYPTYVGGSRSIYGIMFKIGF